ncbi:putative quinol monooxygenase [Phenylobacterium sp.]|jgi:quinol monooxygenase YgiN|uniref:putative quinol monooxygenase n=1 Tax=Phenylobacterium sp. TaxID=1871053 RepID=UPI002F425879
MPVSRRAVAASATAVLAAAGFAPRRAAAQSGAMYGLISQLFAQPGRRDDLVAILLAASAAMPGCLSYVVARDAGREDAIWITEVWRDKASHAASLSLPQVRAAIAKGGALIAGVGTRAETAPAGGAGLAA